MYILFCITLPLLVKSTRVIDAVAIFA
jgi:hypothetical protein